MMTVAMKRAVQWLADHGGSGVVDHHGRVLAAGEASSHIDAATWLRLIAKGIIRETGGRFALVERERT